MSDSIGKVKAQKVTLKGKFELECGQSFNDIELVYETYGVLNADATNAILICHALSGNCLLYTSPSPRDVEESRMPSSA